MRLFGILLALGLLIWLAYRSSFRPMDWPVAPRLAQQTQVRQ
jgi:hypothetical protein